MQAVEREGPMLPAYEEKVGLMIIIKDNEKKEKREEKVLKESRLNEFTDSLQDSRMMEAGV